MGARKSIGLLRREARHEPVAAVVHAQVCELTRKEDRTGKPYWELKLRDGSDSFSLKAWSNTPNFLRCEEIEKGDLVEVEGEFAIGQYGFDAQRWSLRRLEEADAAALFEGDAEVQATNAADFATVRELSEGLEDPRLRALCLAFLEDFSARFRRAVAARNNHHAFRGGLLRHTAQMMKLSDRLCQIEPRLHRDLLLTGALFHDCGKLWEMCPPERGFDIPRDLRGELLGHISIGVEIANALWRKLPLDEWKELSPPSEEVRVHLLHLIASHHGELQFGSPVQPKTPEAIALHHIDNLDARLEMFFAAYETQPEIAPGVHERVWALNVSPVAPLPRPVFPPEAKAAGESELD